MTFASTLDNSTLYSHTLTLSAGAGDIVFDGRVGYNNPIDIGGCSNNVCSGIGAGVPLAGIVIESAGDIDINTPLYPVIGGNTYLNNDGFNVGSFIVEGNGQTCASATCVAGATGSLNAGGSYVSTYRSDGAAGNITIDVGGNVEVGYQVYADPSGSGKGGNGGNVTIVAGGTVQVGDQLGVGPAVSCFVACSTPGAIADEGSYSISAVGYSTFNPGDTAGNGGNVFVQGTAINLPNGVLTVGGAAIQNASTPNAGNGGNVTLIATDGNVTATTPQVGNILGIIAAGGDSLSGKGGKGGTVDIEAQRIILSRIYTLGGATGTSTLADAGASGNITLTATAPSGAAVVFYGNSDSPTVSPGSQSTLDALGGETGAPAIPNDTLTLNIGAGTISGKGGNIVIQGGLGGQALQGTAYVQLENNSANVAFGGGPTIYVLTGGGSTTTAPSIQILGPIEGTTNGAEALRVRDVQQSNVFGSVTIAGDIGDAAKLDYVSLAGASVTVGGYITTQTGNIYPSSISSVTDQSFGANGDVFFNGPVTLANNLQINAGGSITFGNSVPAPVNGAYSLTLNAGSGNVAIDSGSTIGFDTALSAVSITASTIDLNGGSVTTTGAQTYGGAVTLSTDNDLSGTTVTFNSTVGGAHGLTVTGNGVFEGGVDIASLDVTGTADLSGGTVTTSGAQTYGGAVTLSSDDDLTGTIVTFGSTVGGPQALTVTGNAVFDGGVNIASLDVTGTAGLNGGTVTPSGTQTYGGAVTLGTDSDLTTGTIVTFNSTVGGSHALTVTGGGVFQGAVDITSLDVTGTADLNGGSVTTTGAQTYGGAVTLSTDNDLSGTTVTFNSTVGGAHGLTVTGNGVFTGA